MGDESKLETVKKKIGKTCVYRSGSKHLPVKLQLVEGIRAKLQKPRRTQRIEEEGL